MTSTPERQAIITLIQQANADGARLVRACSEADICLRTSPCVRLVGTSTDVRI
jgi:hypothetical protein